jgi:hypothetical protein
VLERSRAESKSHGFSVARNHFWIDILLELPAAIVVLATGLAMLSDTQLAPLLIIKLVAGLIAVSLNVACVVPVVMRKRAADAADLSNVIRYSRMIDGLSAVGLPAFVVALATGLFRAFCPISP